MRISITYKVPPSVIYTWTLEDWFLVKYHAIVHGLPDEQAEVRNGIIASRFRVYEKEDINVKSFYPFFNKKFFPPDEDLYADEDFIKEFKAAFEDKEA